LSRPNKSESHLLDIIYSKSRYSHHCRRSQSDTVLMCFIFQDDCVSIDYFSFEKSCCYDKIPHPLDIRRLLYQSSVQFPTHTLDRSISILAHPTMVSAACCTDNSCARSIQTIQANNLRRTTMYGCQPLVASIERSSIWMPSSLCWFQLASKAPSLLRAYARGAKLPNSEELAGSRFCTSESVV